jgi:hypothetical protein
MLIYTQRMIDPLYAGAHALSASTMRVCIVCFYGIVIIRQEVHWFASHSADMRMRGFTQKSDVKMCVCMCVCMRVCVHVCVFVCVSPEGQSLRRLNKRTLRRLQAATLTVNSTHRLVD